MQTTATPMAIGVGLDTARYGHHASFLRQDLQPAREPFGFAESRQGYAQLRAAFEQLASRHGNVHFQIRIDAAGQYAANLQSFLAKLDFPKTISVGEPKRNKDYRNAHFPKRKADVVDSLACARFAVVECPRATPATPAEFLQLREVLSALQSQTKRTTRLINQLHNRLARAFPELATLVGNLATGSVLTLLHKYPTAEKIAAARLSSLEAIAYLRPEKARRIHEAARQSTASLRGPLIEGLLRQLVEELRQSRAHEKKLGRLLAAAYDGLPKGAHRQLESIVGIGKLTAAVLVANIISIERFATPDRLVNFFGAFPEENSSGCDKQGNPLPPATMRMCQKGNDLVRKLLYMACLSGVRNNPALRALYQRKKAEGKRGDVILGHCMRKLLHLVFAVWKTDQPFDPQHYPWQAAPGAAAGQSAAPPQSAEPLTPEPQANTTKTKKAAGRTGPSPHRKAVTAASCNLKPTDPTDKPAATNPSPDKLGTIDFAALRRQVTIEQVLRKLGHWEWLRGDHTQLRGPCPIHGSQRLDSRSFSVNLQKNAFRCFASNCAAQGNALDLWSAIHNLPLGEAAHHFAITFGLETQPEKRNP